MSGCAGRPNTASEPVRPPEPVFKLDRVVDLVPAAGLVWLVDARPRELFAQPGLRDAVFTVIPEPRWQAFAVRHAGVDFRTASEIAVAEYAGTTLFVAKAPVDPQRVQAALSARAESVTKTTHGGMTWWTGRVGPSPVQVAAFGNEAVAFQRGEDGPLRAAVYFAEARLHRSSPALRANPLAAAAKLVGEAPLRAFAPGPFAGDWARGAAGLLGASTAVACSIRAVAETPDRALAAAPNRAVAARVAMTIVLTGGWGDDAPAAAQRLLAAFRVLAQDPLGRLLGVDRPIDGPAVSADAGALRLDVTLDAVALARGLHAVADATLADIFSD